MKKWFNRATADAGVAEPPTSTTSSSSIARTPGGLTISEILDTLVQCGDPLFVVDQHYRIVAWNKAAQSVLSRTPDQAVGQLCHCLLNGTDLLGQRVCASPCEPMLSLQRGAPPSCFALQVDDGEGGRRPVEISLLPLPGGFAAHILRDASRELSLQQFAARVRDAFEHLAGDKTPSGVETPLPEPPLTDRERDVLRLLADGANTSQIATHLVLSKGTVRTHVQHIFAKLGAHNRLQAVAIARQRRLLT